LLKIGRTAQAFITARTVQNRCIAGVGGIVNVVHLAFKGQRLEHSLSPSSCPLLNRHLADEEELRVLPAKLVHIQTLIQPKRVALFDGLILLLVFGWFIFGMRMFMLGDQSSGECLFSLTF